MILSSHYLDWGPAPKHFRRSKNNDNFVKISVVNEL